MHWRMTLALHTIPDNRLASQPCLPDTMRRSLHAQPPLTHRLESRRRIDRGCDRAVPGLVHRDRAAGRAHVERLSPSSAVSRDSCLSDRRDALDVSGADDGVGSGVRRAPRAAAGTWSAAGYSVGTDAHRRGAGDDDRRAVHRSAQFRYAAVAAAPDTERLAHLARARRADWRHPRRTRPDRLRHIANRVIGARVFFPLHSDPKDAAVILRNYLNSRSSWRLNCPRSACPEPCPERRRRGSRRMAEWGESHV